MQDDAPFARDSRLDRIAELLGADAAEFGSAEPNEHVRLTEMLRLWSRLTRREDKDAALAYLKALGDGHG